jgi:hypothetical protein
VCPAEIAAARNAGRQERHQGDRTPLAVLGPRSDEKNICQTIFLLAFQGFLRGLHCHSTMFRDRPALLSPRSKQTRVSPTQGAKNLNHPTCCKHVPFSPGDHLTYLPMTDLLCRFPTSQHLRRML